MTADYDPDRIDEIALALLSLTAGDPGADARVWKGVDWVVMNRLHEKGWISSPRTKAKSVLLTTEGERLAREFAQRYFTTPDGAG